MRRKTFDALLTTAGLALAIVLIVAGALLTWAHNFVDNQVHSQLAAQQIYFPAAGSASLKALPAADDKAMTKYAGEQMTTGAQAETWADHYIAVHLQKIGGGQTYAQLSSKAQADPSNTQLASQVETVFKGETLRGLLLNAYAFGKMGTIAGIAAIAAFVGAGVMFVLSALGFWHLRRTDPHAELLPKLGAKTAEPASA